MKRVLLVAIGGLVVINVLFLVGLGFVRKSATSQQKKELIKLVCPVPQQYCSKAVPVYRVGKDKKKVFYGFGWSVPEDTPVYSVFAGAVYPVSATLSPRYGQPALSIEQLPGKKLRAIYVFSGEYVFRYTPTDRAGEELFRARTQPVADTAVNVVLRIHQVQNTQARVVEPGQVVFSPL